MPRDFPTGYPVTRFVTRKCESDCTTIERFEGAQKRGSSLCPWPPAGSLANRSAFEFEFSATDFDGKAFYENVFTVNASRAGAMVIEVRTRLKVGEIIGLAYGMA